MPSIKSSTRIPDGLVNACRQGRCVLVVGSGISALGGYPTWHEVVWHLIKLTSLKISPRDLSVGGPGDVVADLIQTNLGPNLQPELKALFAKRPIIGTALKALGRVPFSGILSLNWDDTITQSFQHRNPVVVSGTPSEDLAEAFHPEQFIIVKLYGDLSNESFRFTDTELRNVLIRHQEFARFIASRLQSQELLFLGMSAPSIIQFFKVFPWPLEMRSYIMLPRDTPRSSRSLEEQSLLAGYSTNIIRYREKHADSGLRSFVTDLEGKVRRRHKQPKALTRGTYRLQEIRLQNIAGFINLDLTVHQKTVIIGNNGSGKSSFLRAVCLGLCGEHPEAMAAAAPLLRVDQSKGSILLKVDGATFETELTRTGGAVRVQSRASTPFEEGRWLVLGFPPLRGQSRRQATLRGMDALPANQDVSRSSVGDVFPLLYGGTDQRLDDIKRWIVFLRHFAKDQRRSAAIIESFFAILGDFMSDTTLELAETSDQPLEVRVRTQDGIVSIDQVSQGMMSLFSWVGTTLERLHEVHSKSKDPKNEPMLLLIDEIDAHLHPEWQRRLMSVFGKHFPKAQIIATTHSPLVVAEMTMDEIVVSTRDEESGAALLVPAAVEPAGMRTDQILTSNLFGLTSTRANSTQEEITLYAKLNGKSRRSLREEKIFRKLRVKLQNLLKIGETEFARRVEDAVSRVFEQSDPLEAPLSEEQRLQVADFLQELDLPLEVDSRDRRTKRTYTKKKSPKTNRHGKGRKPREKAAKKSTLKKRASGKKRGSSKRRRAKK